MNLKTPALNKMPVPGNSRFDLPAIFAKDRKVSKVQEFSHPAATPTLLIRGVRQ